MSRPDWFLTAAKIVNYSSHMIEVRQTVAFSTWLQKLKDRRAQERIAQRLVRVEAGLLGDAKFFDGIGELRIDVGPGYRLYFVQRGKVLMILLCGGDKDSQSKDIARAKELERFIVKWNQFCWLKRSRMIDRPARVVATLYDQAGRSISRPVSANPKGRASFRHDLRRRSRPYLKVRHSPAALVLTKICPGRTASI